MQCGTKDIFLGNIRNWLIIDIGCVQFWRDKHCQSDDVDSLCSCRCAFTCGFCKCLSEFPFCQLFLSALSIPLFCYRMINVAEILFYADVFASSHTTHTHDGSLTSFAIESFMPCIYAWNSYRFYEYSSPPLSLSPVSKWLLSISINFL